MARLRRWLRAARHRTKLRGQRWRERQLWVLDLETGGLNPRTDPILAIGMVPIRDGAVAIGDSYYTLVRPRRPIDESSLGIHHILPGDLEDAPELDTALDAVGDRLHGGVVVVHQRSVDIRFLEHGFRACARPLPVFAVIDTVELLLRYARRHGHLTMERTRFPTGLGDARTRFGLPPHRAHEALSDAVATAELFLVLAHRLEARRIGSLL